MGRAVHRGFYEQNLAVPHVRAGRLGVLQPVGNPCGFSTGRTASHPVGGTSHGAEAESDRVGMAEVQPYGLTAAPTPCFSAIQGEEAEQGGCREGDFTFCFY